MQDSGKTQLNPQDSNRFLQRMLAGALFPIGITLPESTLEALEKPLLDRINETQNQNKKKAETDSEDESPDLSTVLAEFGNPQQEPVINVEAPTGGTETTRVPQTRPQGAGAAAAAPVPSPEHAQGAPPIVPLVPVLQGATPEPIADQAGVQAEAPTESANPDAELAELENAFENNVQQQRSTQQEIQKKHDEIEQSLDPLKKQIKDVQKQFNKLKNKRFLLLLAMILCVPTIIGVAFAPELHLLRTLIKTKMDQLSPKLKELKGQLETERANLRAQSVIGDETRLAALAQEAETITQQYNMLMQASGAYS